ncbi:MAG TPA: YIEGIA domain-containing protein [Bacillota bacterium]|nr:YIEGIA domain-containing protein [Bacillota bacterium]
MKQLGGFLSPVEVTTIITAVLVGAYARISTLKVDFRQYPSYPNAYLNNIVIGFVAAALGAVAIPALLAKDFTAVTFLGLAIQQFREIRKMEKESLEDLENTEFTRRGSAYIDGIAKTFEARNYLALTVAVSTSLAMHLLKGQHLLLRICVGIVVGLLVLYFGRRFSKGKTVGDITVVKPGKLEVRGSELYVDDIFVSNLLGTDDARELFAKEGLAAVIYPNETYYRIALENFGQEEAVLFEAVRSLGVKRYRFTRKVFADGRIIIALVPIVQDMDRLMAAIRNTPILETVKKAPALMHSK